MFKLTEDIRAELRAGIGVFVLTFLLFAIVTAVVMGWQGLINAVVIAALVTFFCLFPVLLELLLTSPVKALHWLGRVLVVLSFAAIGVVTGMFLITQMEGVDPAGAGAFIPVLFALLLGYAGWRMRVLGLKY